MVSTLSTMNSIAASRSAADTPPPLLPPRLARCVALSAWSAQPRSKPITVTEATSASLNPKSVASLPAGAAKSVAVVGLAPMAEE
jgi:hypothetical protein